MFVNIHLFVPRNKDVVGREAMFSLEHLFSETRKKSKSTKAPPLQLQYMWCVLALQSEHLHFTLRTSIPHRQQLGSQALNYCCTDLLCFFFKYPFHAESNTRNQRVVFDYNSNSKLISFLQTKKECHLVRIPINKQNPGILCLLDRASSLQLRKEKKPT